MSAGIILRISSGRYNLDAIVGESFWVSGNWAAVISVLTA
jgi:hypothetical protein